MFSGVSLSPNAVVGDLASPMHTGWPTGCSWVGPVAPRVARPGFEFPMVRKTREVGEQAHPFYRALAEATDKPPKWNFHKYLIGRDGRAAAVFDRRTASDLPEVLAPIERALAAKTP